MEIKEINFSEFLEKVRLIKNPAICAKNTGWIDVDDIRIEKGYIFFDWGDRYSWVIEETGLPVATFNNEVYFLQGQFNKKNIAKADKNLISVEPHIPIYSEFNQQLTGSDGQTYVNKSYLVMNLNLYGLMICDKTTSYLDNKEELINGINLYFLEKRLDRIDNFLKSKQADNVTDDDIREKMNTLRRMIEKLLKIYLFYKSRELSYNVYDKVESLSSNVVGELKKLVELNDAEKAALSKLEYQIHRFSHDEPVTDGLQIAVKLVTDFREFCELLRNRMENDPGNSQWVLEEIMQDSKK